MLVFARYASGSCGSSGIVSRFWRALATTLAICAAFTTLAIMGLAIGLWYFSGTDYVSGAVVNGELQIGKVIPTMLVGVGGIATLVYLLFIRQD